MKDILNKFIFFVCVLVLMALTFLFIVGTNYSSFQRSLSSFENSLIEKESIDGIEYKELDYIYSKKNSEKLINNDSLNNKGIYVFKNATYILYGNKFFKVDLSEDNRILYDDKLGSFYVFDVYKDIVNIFIMFTIGLLTILFVKIRLKYLKFEDGFKSNYNLSVLNKNIFVELWFIILILFVIVKCFSFYIFNIPSTHISVLLFVLIYVGNIMLKEYKIRKNVLLKKYDSYLNSVKSDIEKENSNLRKLLSKKYKNYNFKELLNNNDKAINVKEFKVYLIDKLIDIDTLGEYEKIKLILDFKKLTDV